MCVKVLVSFTTGFGVALRISSSGVDVPSGEVWMVLSVLLSVCFRVASAVMTGEDVDVLGITALEVGPPATSSVGM